MSDIPLPFGPNSIWYSVRSSDPSAVLDGFGLTEAGEATWRESLLQSYRESLLITPPANGWTLVAGRCLASPVYPGPRASVSEQLRRLSRSFGESQFFANVRGTNLYCWMQSIAGDVTRAFVYSGELLVDMGVKTEIESNLPWESLNLDLEMADDDAFWDAEPFPTEESVLTVASDWSVSPADVHSYARGPVLL
ncbi:MAG: hypothetical protein GY722_25395, partial [bacterium]|nr:hypothetical protein [bacterium]